MAALADSPLWYAAPWLLKLANAVIQGKMEQRQDQLASEAVDNLEKLGPTFIKLGQILSIRCACLHGPAGCACLTVSVMLVCTPVALHSWPASALAKSKTQYNSLELGCVVKPEHVR